jgi:hypothetical protein
MRVLAVYADQGVVSFVSYDYCHDFILSVVR